MLIYDLMVCNDLAPRSYRKIQGQFKVTVRKNVFNVDDLWYFNAETIIFYWRNIWRSNFTLNCLVMANKGVT